MENGRTARGLSVRLRWLGGAVALGSAIAVALMLRAEPEGSRAALPWLIGMAALLFATAGVKTHPFLEPPPGPARTTRGEALLMVGIVAVALAFRLYRLTEHPGLFGDEGEQGCEARAINEGGRAPVFAYGWWGVPNVYFHLLALSLRVFGDDIFGLRFPSVLCGALLVVVVWRIGRIMSGPRAGILAAAFLSTWPVMVQFGRWGSVSAPTGLLWAAGFLFLLVGLRGFAAGWVASGLCYGLGLHFYASGKLALGFVPLALVVCLVTWRGRFVRRGAGPAALIVLAFSLAVLPNLLHSLRDWQGFAGRAGETSIFSPPLQADTFRRWGLPWQDGWEKEPLGSSLRHRPGLWGKVLFFQVRESLGTLWDRPDATLFYQGVERRGVITWRPLAAVTVAGALFCLGTALRGARGLLLAWYLVGMFGCALTVNTPSLQRCVTALPAVVLFSALLLDRAAGLLDRPLGPLGRRLAIPPLLAFVLLSARADEEEYFVRYAAVRPFREGDELARTVRSLGARTHVLLFGADAVDFDYGTTRFAAKGVRGADVRDAAAALPPVTREPAIAAMVWWNNATYDAPVRWLLPGGRESTVRDRAGQVTSRIHRVSAARLAALRTVTATCVGADGRAVERPEPRLGTQGAAVPPPEAASPARAEWRGLLTAPVWGRYRFELSGVADARLELDGETLLAAPGAVERALARGRHDVRLAATLAGPSDRAALRWGGEGAGLFPIGARFLSHVAPGGLSAEVYPADRTRPLEIPAGVPPRFLRSDPFVAVRGAQWAFSDPPVVVRWRGSLVVTTGGEHVLELAGGGTARVTLDGAPVLDFQGSPEDAVNAVPVTLAPGRHALEVVVAPSGGNSRIELFWTPPGGARGLVPPSALEPGPRSFPVEAVPGAPPARADLRPS